VLPEDLVVVPDCFVEDEEERVVVEEELRVVCEEPVREVAPVALV